MSFWNWFSKQALSQSSDDIRGRVSNWWGHHLALRYKQVSIGFGCYISPDSIIHPRKGSITIGDGCIVGTGAILQGNIKLGNNCSVQTNAMLVGYGDTEDKNGLIQIGDNVRIAPYVMMIAANHNFDRIDTPICKQGLTAKPIVIEDDVWVAGRVNIMAGVTVGTGSVIGAGAIVTHDIPPYSVAVGNPARVIKKRKP